MQENENLEIDETENETKTNMTHVVLCADEKTKEIKNYTRAKAIKLFCVECMGFEWNYIKDCTAKLCPLYPFRGATLQNHSSIENEISPAKKAAMEKARNALNSIKRPQATQQKE